MFSTDVCGGHAVNFSIDKTRADGASYIYNNKPEERAARMVLTIDIGNTNIVLGGYENGALGFCTRISTDKSLEADQYALELSGILNLYKVAGETSKAPSFPAWCRRSPTQWRGRCACLRAWNR